MNIKYFKILSTILLLILFSLSCDTTEPTAPVVQDSDYLVSIASAVEQCYMVGCINSCIANEGSDNNSACTSILDEDECKNSDLDCLWDNVINQAYNADVVAPENPDNSSWYNLSFQIQLKETDDNGDFSIPVEGATFTINSNLNNASTTDIVTAQLVTFSETTNSQGIINGYWSDNGETGEYTITAKYTYADEYGNSNIYTGSYDIQVNPISEVVSSISANVAEDLLTILTEDIYTDTIYARVKNAYNTYLENVEVTFEIVEGTGGLSSTTAVTQKPEESSPSAYAFVLYSTEYGVNDDNILIRASAPCVEDESNPNCINQVVSSNTYIELTSEVFPAELDVENLVINIAPDTLIIITEDEIADSSYSIEVRATARDEFGSAVENVPMSFSIINQDGSDSYIGTLIETDLVSDSSGTATAIVVVEEGEIVNKDQIEIGTIIYHPDYLENNEILFDMTSTANVYTDAYYYIEAAESMNSWAITGEQIIDNTLTYETSLHAEVLNQFGAKMPNMSVQFAIISGEGSLDYSIANTDSLTGDAAQAIFTLNPSTFQGETNQADVSFAISLFEAEEAENLIDTLNISYLLDGSSEPELDVSEFHFYPNSDVVGHDLYDQTQISVIAKDDNGVGVPNVLVRFQLSESERSSNGEINEALAYTCCSSGEIDSTGTDTTSQVGQNGVASVVYTNIEGGIDLLTAYILDPYTSDIITDEDGIEIGLDEITILTNDACPNCIEELQVKSSTYELPSEDSQSEQTNIYAFYTDSLGNNPELNSFINFKPWQQDETGDWINTGSISPENAFFESGTVADLDNNIFPNSPSDSSIVFAEASFNMENSSGLVKIVGSYLELTDTLGIQINSTGASFVEIIPPFPSQIAVQGSPDIESTILTAEIRDGNGNLVSDSYITRFTLGTSAVLAGVHFNGEENTTDTFNYSSNGSASVTLNSGNTPVSVGLTVSVYDYAEINSVDEIDEATLITSAQAVPVTIASGPPTSGIIGYSFLEAINIGGGLTEMPVSIVLWDTWANPVADSISVYFTLNPPDAATINAEAKTANIKPNGTQDDSWPGVAWTTIIYNASQLFNFPEIIATTTGNICSDNESPYDLCVEDGNGTTWLEDVTLTYSSLDNIVSYQNVCVDCGLTLVSLSDTQHDFECSPGTFEVDVRAQLLDFYGVPVEGAVVELLLLGTQGGPSIEAIEYLCFMDMNGNGSYDDGTDIDLELNEEECGEVNNAIWGQSFFPEPPSTTVLTDQFGLKYWRITFSSNECVQTGANPTQYTCSTPSIQANLVNPNGALSEELNITINSTCFE